MENIKIEFEERTESERARERERVTSRGAERESVKAEERGQPTSNPIIPGRQAGRM